VKAWSFARALLEHFGFVVDDIPTADRERRKEADFKATLCGVTLLLEEKTKEENPFSTAKREATHAQGAFHVETLPVTRDETVSGVIRNAASQLRSSSRHAHDFRLMWFTATGPTAEGKYEQFMATLYGRSNVLELGSDGYRRCYFYRNSDFFWRRDVIDGAVAAYTDGPTISAKVCLNPLSPRFEALRRSPVLKPFGTAIEDPLKLEAEGGAFVLDAELDRRVEGPLLDYLQKKYSTGPLMAIDLGYTRASVSIARE
jgi:hypothetical protein